MIWKIHITWFVREILEAPCLDPLCLPDQITKPFALLLHEMPKFFRGIHWDIRDGSQQDTDDFFQHGFGEHPATVVMDPVKQLFGARFFHCAPGKQQTSHLNLVHIQSVFDKLGHLKSRTISNMFL